MLCPHSSPSCLITNLPPLPWFVPDGLQNWSRPFRGHVSILGYFSFLMLVMNCLYFPEDLLPVLSEVCSSEFGLLPLAPALGFSSSHKYVRYI